MMIGLLLSLKGQGWRFLAVCLIGLGRAQDDGLVGSALCPGEDVLSYHHGSTETRHKKIDGTMGSE